MNPYHEAQSQSNCHSPALPTARSVCRLLDEINTSVAMDPKTQPAAKAGCSAKRLIDSPTTLFCLQAAQSSPQLGANPTVLLLSIVRLYQLQAMVSSTKRLCDCQVGVGSFERPDAGLVGLPLVMDGIWLNSCLMELRGERCKNWE